MGVASPLDDTGTVAELLLFLFVLLLVQDVPKLSGAATKLRVQWAKEPEAAA